MNIYISMNGRNLDAKMVNAFGAKIPGSGISNPYTTRPKKDVALEAVRKLGRGYDNITYEFDEEVPEEVQREVQVALTSQIEKRLS